MKNPTFLIDNLFLISLSVHGERGADSLYKLTSKSYRLFFAMSRVECVLGNNLSKVDGLREPNTIYPCVLGL